MPLDEYKCWQCGKELTADGWEPQKRVFCEECEKKHREEYQKTVSEYVALKIRVMYERALREMENANCYMHEYYAIAPEILADALETPNKYQSADEMIAAMVLISNGYEFEMQLISGPYNVDIFIPELHVCLEIDGERHEHRADYDSKRDIEIRRTLGDAWEVIRIPTKYMEQNPEALPDAIEASYRQKKKYRKENGGFLPNSYSKREAAHYQKAMVYQYRKTAR